MLGSYFKICFERIKSILQIILAHAFSDNAPCVWNGLPKVVRDCFSESTPPASTEMFKKLLKTALFTPSFDIATA